jgi:hypothetical protein
LDFANEPKVEIPGEGYFQSYWKGRFSVFQNKSKYSNFVTALNTEREKIDDVVSNISINLRSAEYKTDNLPEALSKFCFDLEEFLKAQTQAKMPYPHPPFDDLKQRKVFTERKDVWRTAVKRAQEVVSSKDFMSVLTFNSRTLKEVESMLDITLKYISLIEKDLAFHNERFEKEGDPDALAKTLLDTLENIEKIGS